MVGWSCAGLLPQAIQEVRGNNKVQDQDPEGKYEALGKYARDLTKVRLRVRGGGGGRHGLAWCTPGGHRPPGGYACRARGFQPAD